MKDDTKWSKRIYVMSKNKTFVIINVALVALIVLGIIFSIIDNCCWDIKWGESGVDMLCQIVTSAVFFVSSTIAISISLQNDECFGIPVKKFNSLRANYHYSIMGIVICSIGFVVVSIAFYILELMFATITVAVSAIAFCIYISVVEIPLMTKSEKALIEVVKKRVAFEFDKVLGPQIASDNPKNLKDVLKHLMVHEYNLETTYDCLKSQDDKFNKYLLLKLLEIHCDVAFELEQVQDKTLRYKIVGRLINNMRDILNFNFDLTPILGDEILQYKHLITRVLFRTLETEEGQKKTAHILAHYISLLSYAKTDEVKKKFVLQIVISMVSITVASNNFVLAEVIRKECSEHSYNLGKPDALSMLFGLMSMHFYYLSTAAHDVTKELKEGIARFIDSNAIVENTKTRSWRQLYAKFAENFSLDFAEFLYYFNENNHNWDVPLYGGGAHVWVLGDEYALTWYLAHLFNSPDRYNYDYAKLLDASQEIEYYIKKIGDSIFEEQPVLKFPQKMIDIVQFYIPKFQKFEWFEFFEEREKRFSTFVGSLHKKDFEKRLEEAKKAKKEEIVSRYRTQVSEKITQDWGYDASISLEKSSEKFLRVMTQKTSEAVNFDDVMIDYFVNSIRHELWANTNKTVLKRTSKFAEHLMDYLKHRLIAITKQSEYVILHYLRGENCEDAFREVVEKAQKIESRLMQEHTLFFGNGFGFNFEISAFDAVELNEEQVSEKVEEYKQADGQYIFEGAFLSREEIEKYVRAEYIVLTVGIRYNIVSDASEIITIDLFPDDEKDDEGDEPTGDNEEGQA